jgi:glutamine synthetase adenylyltransferase
MEELFAEPLRGLARRVAEVINEPTLGSAVLQRVAQRAPDERLALAQMLRLGEQSAPALTDALRDTARADDLVFCLGGSELIGAGLVAAGPDWVTEFDHGRGPMAQASDDLPQDPASVAELGTNKRRRLVRIAIADLLSRCTVPETVAAMSRLAADCIRIALALVAREFDPPELVARFCVLAMGKLGAQELNLSSDIDLVYLIDEECDPAILAKAQRIGERLTEILAAQCFRVDLRLRPGGTTSPLVASVNSALSFSGWVTLHRAVPAVTCWPTWTINSCNTPLVPARTLS